MTWVIVDERGRPVYPVLRVMGGRPVPNDLLDALSARLDQAWAKCRSDSALTTDFVRQVWRDLPPDTVLEFWRSPSETSAAAPEARHE